MDAGHLTSDCCWRGRHQARALGVEVTSRDDGLFIYCGTAVEALINMEANAEGMRPWNGTVRILRKGYVAHATVQLMPRQEDP